MQSSVTATMALTIEAQTALAPLAASEPTDSPMDAGERAQLLEQLWQGIADSNPEALDIAAKLLSGLSEGDSEFGALTAVRDALDIYDFAGAAEQLDSLPS